jgi:mRNA interferase MazF
MKQGEIWLINLDPTLGAELKKTRPAIIVNNNVLGRLPLKIIVPITDWKERYSIAPWMVKIEVDDLNNLTKTSTADCFQIRSLSQERFIKRIGEIKSYQLEEIKRAIMKVIQI